jgi:hypothetical protein
MKSRMYNVLMSAPVSESENLEKMLTRAIKVGGHVTTI